MPAPGVVGELLHRPGVLLAFVVPAVEARPDTYVLEHRQTGRLETVDGTGTFAGAGHGVRAFRRSAATLTRNSIQGG